MRTERLKLKDPVTKREKSVPFGSHTQVKVIKSKIDAKQGQTADIFIRFGQGIDDIYTTIEAGVAHKVIKKTGAFFELDGEKYQGREKLRKFLMGSQAALDGLQATVLKAIRLQAEVDPDVDLGVVEDEVDALLTSSFGADEDRDDEAHTPVEVELEDEE
jgi:recombination protein RecA